MPASSWKAPSGIEPALQREEAMIGLRYVKPSSADVATPPLFDVPRPMSGYVLDPCQYRPCCFTFSEDAAVSESIMAQATIAYLERRYAVLEKEMENALQAGRTDHPAMSVLVFRKLIVAE
jgi:hypothetical protein